MSKNKIAYQAKKIEFQSVGLVNREKTADTEEEEPYACFNGNDFAGFKGSTKIERLRNAPISANACDLCRSRDTYIYATRGILRYVKCRRCGFTFKQTE